MPQQFQPRIGERPENIIRANMFWLIVFIILGLIALWHTVIGEEGTTWGTVYLSVFIVTITLFILSVIAPRVFEFRNINPHGVGLQIFVGFMLGFALVGGVFLDQNASCDTPSTSSIVPFLSPLPIPLQAGNGGLGLLGWAAIAQVFIMALVVSEFEESIRSAALRPTIAEWLTNRWGICVTFFTFGMIIYFLIEPIRLIGLVMMVLGFANSLKDFLSGFFQHVWAHYTTSIIIGGIFFAILHLKAYSIAGAPTDVTNALMLNAFMFAVIADFINTQFDSTAPSKIAHTLSNATIGCLCVGIPLWFAFVVAGSHAVLIFILSRAAAGESIRGSVRTRSGSRSLFAFPNAV